MTYPVVLVNVSRNTNAISFPMGLSVVANALLHHDITPQIIDLIPVMPDQRIDYFLRTMPKEPAIYGFSMMIGNFHLDHAEHYARLIKEHSPDSIVVYGGSLPSSVPELLVENCECDFVIHGEGEVVFPAFVKALREGESFPEGPGIFYKGADGQVVGTKAKRMRRLDHLSRQNYSLFDMDFYSGYFKEVGLSWEIMASRGCKAHCSFCYKFMGDGIGLREVGEVLDEIQYIMENYGITKFYFVDENFMQIKKYFYSFLEEKKNRGLNFTFIASSRIDEIDEERISIAKEHGLTALTTGVESVNQATLNAIDKRIDIEDAERAVKLLRQYGIRPHVNLIIGFEWESEDDYKAMLEFIERNDLRGTVKLSYLTPLPATRLYEDAKSRNKLGKPEFEYVRTLGNLYWELMVNMTNMPDELLKHYYALISDVGKETRALPVTPAYRQNLNDDLVMYKTVAAPSPPPAHAAWSLP
ncbi:Radical SAM domain protein [Paramagnetospirillum magnetotacticum MS-1]|uniref:Radical SAM domain protein n=1 Tax=Paramagnetospirillum magnetotacticum MS-1 TaxID=272627 RepID=A0A0C2YSS3_PARME|nr:radical SAM protein [Paramagnetospirillum magnetotacticum]KIL97770.1 Radical SAM domain protein [Paramagnetospirillum magnetotacticum MS-1]